MGRIKMSKKQLSNFIWDEKDLLGEGSFGTVYKGSNTKDNTVVAVKIMNKSDFQTQDMVQSLETELEVSMLIKGDNVVNTYHVEKDNVHIYVFQEFCGQGDLSKFIENNGIRDPRSEHLPWLQYGQYLKESQAIDVVQQFMRGFKTLTDKGYIHRDIKPPNVLCKDNLIKVADFGFAAKVDLSGRTKMHEFCGSPLYESPQILQQKPYGAKTDIWSVGMMFYEMLFANTPWTCRDVNSFVRNMTTKPYISFPYKQNISDVTKDFIRQCLVIDENKRIGWDKIYLHPLLQSGVKLDDGKQHKLQVDEQTQQILAFAQNQAQLKGINVLEVMAKFDTSQDKKLDTSEFYSFLKSICNTLTYTEALKVFQAIDVNQDGTVSVEEFKTFFCDNDFNSVSNVAEKIVNDLKQIIMSYNLKIKDIFEYNDKDGSGTMDFGEFQHMIKKIAPKLKDREIRQAFSFFDGDHSGSITFKEFQDGLCEGCNNQDGHNETTHEARRLLGELKRIVKEKNLDVAKIYGNFDKNKDGKLDASEFFKMLKIINPNAHEEEARVGFGLLDTNNTGNINFDEFLTFIQKK